MKKILQNKKWNVGVVQLHMEPQRTPMIKSKHDDNLYNYFVKLKLHTYQTPEKTELCGLKIALLENYEPE